MSSLLFASLCFCMREFTTYHGSRWFSKLQNTTTPHAKRHTCKKRSHTHPGIPERVLHEISHCLLSRTASLAENNKTYPGTWEAERFRARPDAKKCRFCGASKKAFYQILTLLRRDRGKGLSERTSGFVKGVHYPEDSLCFRLQLARQCRDYVVLCEQVSNRAKESGEL